MANELTTPTDDHLPALVVELGERARGYAEAAKAANTRRAYRSDWKVFETWCADRKVVALPADPNAVLAYLIEHAGKVRVSNSAASPVSHPGSPPLSRHKAGHIVSGLPGRMARHPADPRLPTEQEGSAPDREPAQGDRDPSGHSIGSTGSGAAAHRFQCRASEGGISWSRGSAAGRGPGMDRGNP